MNAKDLCGCDIRGCGRGTDCYYTLHIPTIERSVVASSIHGYYLDVGWCYFEIFEIGIVHIPGE